MKDLSFFKFWGPIFINIEFDHLFHSKYKQITDNEQRNKLYLQKAKDLVNNLSNDEFRTMFIGRNELVSHAVYVKNELHFMGAFQSWWYTWLKA